MGTTTNYSWPYPEATGLVKDGWEDIKDLATAIDTTAASSFGGGLTKISTTTFTTQSSISLANDTFTTTYDDYIVILKLTATSANNTVVYMKLRAAGTDSSASYYWNRFGTYTGNATPGGTVATNNSSGIWLQSTYSTGFFPTITKIDLFNVKLATNTAMLVNTHHNSGGGDAASFSGGGFHNSASAYDSATFYPASGTISGSAIVYGVKI